MTTPRVQLDIADDIATIRVTRADARNAIDPQFVTDLVSAIGQAIEPGAARAVLLLADGAHFTVGGDLDHFTDNADRLGEELRDMVGPFNTALADLAEAPLPVIAGARGAAAGGGLGMLWAADIVIAGDDLKVALGFARIGLTGDGGWSYYVPRLVGMRRAQELALENRVLGAQEALDWQLVTRVVAAGDVEQEARATAARLAAGPTLALGRMRQMIHESYGASLREQMTAELDAMTQIGATGDAAEGVTSFSQKRTPSFAAS